MSDVRSSQSRREFWSNVRTVLLVFAACVAVSALFVAGEAVWEWLS